MRPGYKQTEVGVIPQDWEVQPFTGVTSLITCGIAATPEYVSERRGYPFLSSSNVKEGRIVWSDYKHISADLHRQLYRNNPPQKGDILYSRVGTFGEAAVVDVDFEFSVYVSLTLIKPGKPLDSFFLMQLLNSNAYKRRAKDQIYLGGGVGNLNVDVVRRYPIVIPPLPEQRAIAAALTDVDALLDGQNRLIAKKRDLKQAAMQQLLTGQTRLPGFHGEWEVKQLGDAGRCLRGVSYRGDSDLAAYDTAHTKRLLRANNVQSAVVVTQDVQFVNADRVSKQQILLQDDILVCMANGSKALVGKAGLFAVGDGHEYTFGAFMGCFRTDARSAHPRFVFALFQTGQYRDYINNLLAGSSINNLRPSSVESLQFRFPKLQEQVAIAAALSDIDAELSALEARRDKTRGIKQGMMQELLTGRTRLVPVETTNA